MVLTKSLSPLEHRSPGEISKGTIRETILPYGPYINVWVWRSEKLGAPIKDLESNN